MIQVDDKIISFDVFEKQFVCDLSACKGACCVEGDAGAPLTDKELDVLPNIYNEVKSYMRTEGIAEIEKQLKETGDLWSGYNPRTQEFVNMFNEGIIDPTKVTRLALENAASVAGTMLITEAVVSNVKDKKASPSMDPSMMM